DSSIPSVNGYVQTATDYAFVKYGTGATLLNYNFSAGNSLTSMKIVPSAGPIALISGPDYLNLWVYGDSSGNTLSIQTADSSGNAINSSTSYPINFTGYRQLSFPIPSNASKLTGIILTSSANSKSSGTLFLDQMIASYDTAFTDSTPPTISITSYPGSGDNKTRIIANVSDIGGLSLKNLKVTLTLDGVKTNSTFDQITGALSYEIEDLSAGIHRATLTATDIAGNYTRTSITFSSGDSQKTTFADMNNHWSSSYVNFLYGKKVISGEQKDNKYYFSPERNTTRLEMAVMIAKYIGYDLDICADVTLPFEDASQIPNWALPYVKALYKDGLMLGKTVNGKVYFSPNANITRMEAMTILGRTLPQGCQVISSTFTDDSKIAYWAKTYLNNLASLGIIAGYPNGSILPTNNIKRSEIASILFKLY
ncbi:MAG: S-layer homology domain-containing protein, partial [Clostridiales bacterium]|nr:S-layer homology domain-containing protein [Clostridiales bacterium]